MRISSWCLTSTDSATTERAPPGPASRATRRQQMQKKDGQIAHRAILSRSQHQELLRNSAIRHAQAEKLQSDVPVGEILEAVAWLARGDVRLIIPSKRKELSGSEELGYELAHERLIPALRRVAGKQLGPADLANQLLDRRVYEWLGNGRSARYLLTWRELRLMRQQRPFLQWGPNRNDKQLLLTASWSRLRFRIALSSAPVIAAIVAVVMWNSQWGQLKVAEWEVARFRTHTADRDALTMIAQSYASQGDPSTALQVAEQISEWSAQAYALYGIAVLMARWAEQENKPEVLQQAAAVAERVRLDDPREGALLIIAGTMARLGLAEHNEDLLRQAVEVAERIGEECDKARAFREIAEVATSWEKREQAGQLLAGAIQVTRKRCNQVSAPEVLRQLAETLARLGRPEQANELLHQALLIAGTNIDSGTEDVLRIAETAAKLKEQEWSTTLIKQMIQLADQANPPDAKARAFRQLAATMASVGDSARAGDFLTAAIQATARESNGFTVAENLQGVAETMISWGADLRE